jgi:hypothetical protein
MSTKTPPFLRCDYDVPTVSAIQALSRGDANATQQRDALNWIINHAAATYNVTFDPDSDRATAFAEGRRFVGLQLVKLLHLSTAALLKGHKQNG